MGSITTIAPCGINCTLCHAFQDVKKKCPGCRSKIGVIRKSCLNCAISNCDKKTNYCFECMEYPCKQLKYLDRQYQLRYKMSILENLDYIRQKGEEAFIVSQNEKYTCPDCGKLRTVHYDYCIYCKQEKKK